MADKIILHEEEVREYLSKLAGVVQVLDGVPGFLRGDNDQGQSIRLTKEELGGYDKFYASWDELCDSRLREATRIAHFMSANRKKLLKAAEGLLGVDMDLAATFPSTDDPEARIPGDSRPTPEDSLETAVERQGLDVTTENEAAHNKHPNIPE